MTARETEKRTAHAKELKPQRFIWSKEGARKAAKLAREIEEKLALTECEG